jgi:hypothetical protein
MNQRFLCKYWDPPIRRTATTSTLLRFLFAGTELSDRTKGLFFTASTEIHSSSAWVKCTVELSVGVSSSSKGGAAAATDLVPSAHAVDSSNP